MLKRALLCASLLYGLTIAGAASAAEAIEQPGIQPAPVNPAPVSPRQERDQVTLFSSGTASFERTIELAADEHRLIRITVSSEHLADVLGSLTIRGEDVTVTRPATFPLGASESERRLEIDATRSLESLATRLSGAKVSLSLTGSNLTGTLVGMDSSDAAKHLVIRTEEGAITRVPLESALQLSFEDPEIRSEVARALARNIAAINPATTVIELELYSQKGGSARVQYTHAAAAWTLAYRLQENARGYTLEGHAIVHNNTAEDWANASLKLVVGKPIDFNTDIARVKVPRRDTVNLVDEHAAGPIQDSQEMLGRGLKSRSFSGAADMAAASAAPMLESSAFGTMASSEAVGSYVEYRSFRPVTIPAGNSADVPVLSYDLADSETVLLSKNGARNPYQAVRLSNTTGATLGKGVCAVFNQQGTFDGRVVLESTTAGSERVLAHKIENRVSVEPQPLAIKRELLNVELARGVFITSTRFTATQKYQLANAIDDELSLVLEHYCRFPESELKASVDGASISREGQLARITIPLSAGASECTITEVRTDRRELRVESDLNSVDQELRSFVASSGEDVLQRNPALAAYVLLQKRVDSLNQEQNTLQRETADLEKELAEVRSNLEAVKGVNEVAAARWGKELEESFETLRKKRTRIRDIGKQIQDLQNQQRTALLALSFSWGQ